MSKIKRLIALVLLFITITFNVAVAEVQAETVQCDAVTDILVAVGSVICTETALAYALGAFGFTAASVAVYENRDTLISWCEDVKADFIDFCAKSEEWVSVTGAKIQNWLEGIGTGVLDKADETYLALKDFCVDIFNKQKVGDVSQGANVAKVIDIENFSELFDSLNNPKEVTEFRFNSGDIANAVIQSNTDSFYVADWYLSGKHTIKLDDGTEELENNTFTKFNDSGHVLFKFYGKDGSFSYRLINFATNVLEKNPLELELKDYPYSFMYAGKDDVWSFNYALRYFAYKDSFCRGSSLEARYINPTEEFYKNFTIFDTHSLLSDFDTTSSVFYAILGYIATCYYHKIAIPGLDIPLDDGISEEDTAGYVVDGSVSDVIERDGTLDNVDIINPPNVYEEDKDKVFVDVDGVDIGGIAKPFPDDRVWTIDKSVDVILPDNEPVPQPDEDDSSIDDFTLEGLEKVFPFCVPFDLRDIIETLSADAEAPVFTWKFTYYDEEGEKQKEIKLDLSIFDSVALVMRTMQLLLFIVGLLLLTRNSIMSR